jgi:hypothetical protein
VLYRGPFVDESRPDEPPEICDLKPVVVVEDSDEIVALWLPAGTPTKLSVGLVPDLRLPWRKGEWSLEDGTWGWCDCLFLVRPGEWRATWVLWWPNERTASSHSRAKNGRPATRDLLTPGGPGDPMGWYVNLQEPLVRTPLGFDTRDLQLDIVVDTKRRWHWKDEDELDRSVVLGTISGGVAARARAEAERAVFDIESAAFPFTEDWLKWRPDPDWAVPRIPPGAQVLVPYTGTTTSLKPIV